MKKAGALPVLQRISGTSLTRYADEVLLSLAEIVCEGAVLDDDESLFGKTFTGSVMLTVSLEKAGLLDHVTDDSGAALITALKKSISLHVRLMRTARHEAERRCVPFLPMEMRTELEFTIEGGLLLMDIDIECPLAMPGDRVDDASGDTI